MKRPMLLTGILLAMMALPQLATLAWSETPLAVLMSVAGEVTVVKSGGTSQKGTFGFPLSAGDEVRTGHNSSADILFNGGSLIQIGANSSTTVKGVQRPSGQPSVDGTQVAAVSGKSFDQVQSFLKLKDAQGTSSLAGLRSGGKEQHLQAASPAQTKIRDAHPTFHWSASDPSAELQLKLYADDGEVWNHTVASADRIEYPADAPTLEPGKSYSWTVETTDPLLFPPQRSQAVFFEILTPAEATEIDQALGEIKHETGPNPSSYHIVRASLFFSHGLMDDAIGETRAALDADPDNQTLKSILARLYADVGRASDAVSLLDSK